MGAHADSVKQSDFGLHEGCPYGEIFGEVTFPDGPDGTPVPNRAGMAFAIEVAGALETRQCDYITTGRCRVAELAIRKAATGPEDL